MATKITTPPISGYSNPQSSCILPSRCAIFNFSEN